MFCIQLCFQYEQFLSPFISIPGLRGQDSFIIYRSRQKLCDHTKPNKPVLILYFQFFY